MTEATPKEKITTLIHDTLGTEFARIGVDVMEDRVRVTVPVRNYPVSGVSALARRTGHMYEVSETADTGTIDFMDNPERAEREGRAPHTGEEILAALAGHLARHPGYAEAESPEKPTSPPTFVERITTQAPEQLELIPR